MGPYMRKKFRQTPLDVRGGPKGVRRSQLGAFWTSDGLVFTLTILAKYLVLSRLLEGFTKRS